MNLLPFVPRCYSHSVFSKPAQGMIHHPSCQDMMRPLPALLLYWNLAQERLQWTGIEQMETVEIVPTPGMIYHPSCQDMMDLLGVENLKGGDRLEGPRWAPAQVPIQRGQSLL